MEEKKKCLHKACECESADGSDYCSLYCETANAQHEEGDGCGCRSSRHAVPAKLKSYSRCSANPSLQSTGALVSRGE